MKKMLFAAALVAAACTSQVSENQCQVEVNVENLPETMVMMVVNAEMTDYESRDTINAVDGKFTYTATIDGARRANLVSLDGSANMSVYLLPGHKLVLTGDAEGEYHMGGSEAYKQIDEASSLGDEAQNKINELQNEFMNRLGTGESEDDVRADIMPKYEAIVEEVKKAEAAYIEANPSSQGSVLLLTQMDAEDFEKYDAIVTEEAKNGALAPFYNKAKENYEKDMERRAAKETLGEGAEAPDFTLPTIDGGTLALSSLRGKYVVIDFWGSWCGWCIKGMPDMKKYYEKYAGKLEILGVDCGDTDDKWKAAVEQHELPWKHVKNGEGDNDITTRYAIEGYPTKLIIDPEGKIVKYIVGEDPAFYTALDEVLGK